MLVAEGDPQYSVG